MRSARAIFLLPILVVLGAVAACQGEDFDADGDPDGTPDAGSAADGGSTNDDGSASPDAPADGAPRSDSGPEVPGFQVVSPDIVLDPGQEVSTCYHFRTTNAADLAIKSWRSKQGPGISHVGLVFTDTEKAAPGTLSSEDCVIFGAQGASWVYSAWTPSAGWSFPADDGTGKPLGKPVKANQAAYLVIQMQNGTGAKLTSHVELEAAAYPAGTTVTSAEPYVAYNGSISVPANNSSTVTATCSVPAGAKLTWMTMYAHRSATKMYIQDHLGTAVFGSQDFANPGARTWDAPPFYSFPNNQVSTVCSIVNGTQQTLMSGPHPASDAACVMLSYHFPADKPRLCSSGTLLP